jgi:hypothetical protein
LSANSIYMKPEMILACAVLALSCGQGKQQQQSEETLQASANMPVIQSTDTARKNLIQENLFEEADYLHGFSKGQSCCEYSVQQVNGAVRFEVRKTDETVSGSKRAEVSGKGYSTEGRWYGFRIKLEDWIPDNPGESVIQWHPVDKKGSSNVSVWASGGMYMLVVSPDGSENNYYELDTIQSGVPVDFVLHIQWSPSANGMVEIWKDGKYITKTRNDKLLPYKGITSSAGSYLKLGINKFGWSYPEGLKESVATKRILYYEEFREGNEQARYEDVKPAK